MPKTLIPSNPTSKRSKPEGVILNIAEMFSDTIQGEGASSGVPSTFLRLQNCTLNCIWCDTTEVWRDGNPYTIKEVLDIFDKENLQHKFQQGQHLILTGGSPLLQDVALTYLIEQFILRFGFKPYIEIENECVRKPYSDLIQYIDQWNNSPKLANSEMKHKLRYKPEVIKQTAKFNNSWFKFVISKEEDWNEVVTDYLQTGLIDRQQIILMPEGQDQERLAITRSFVADLACSENLRFCSRLHVDVWDRKTGV